MFRKTMIFALAFIMAAGMLSAAELVPLEPVKVLSSRGPVISDQLDDWSDLFQIRRYTSDAEYYLGSGALNDTFAVVFQPLAACSIYVAQQQWFSAGNYQAFMWEYSEDAAALSPMGRAPSRGTFEVSPLGEVVFGPFVNSAEGSQDWENLFTPEDLPGGGIAWDNSPFIVGFVKTQDDGLPQPLADDVTARRFTYTWFFGPWTADLDYYWGAYSGDVEAGTVVDMMTRVLVAYTENPPPLIGSMDQLSNTVNWEKDCTVNAEIIDDNGWTTDTASLMVSVNNGDAVEYPMTDDDGDDIFTATFNLADVDATPEAGDQIAYWIEATDDVGAFNSNADDQLYFNLVSFEHPNDAPILVVADGMGDRANVLTTYLDAAEITYEYWDVAANKGLDTYTVDWGNWNTIIVCGWGVSSMTTRDWTNSVYANAINNGINIIFSDMDYFYGNGEDAEPTFAEGDLAYDLFGIQSGTNDPQPTDSTFFGEDGDPVSGAFVDEAYTTYPNLYSGDWADFVSPAAGATAIFSGETLGNPMAIRKENGSQKAIYFAFDIFSACEDDGEGNLVPTVDFNTLMDDMLAYVGPEVSVGEDNSAPVPQTFVLNQNYPNPFNPTTTISFVVPRVEQVKLTVFNINGRQVATLFDGAMAPGTKSLTFDAGNLSSGIYFYRLDAGSATATRKMVLMK